MDIQSKLSKVKALASQLQVERQAVQSLQVLYNKKQHEKEVLEKECELKTVTHALNNL